jgi:hypothetical protein
MKPSLTTREVPIVRSSLKAPNHDVFLSLSHAIFVKIIQLRSRCPPLIARSQSATRKRPRVNNSLIPLILPCKHAGAITIVVPFRDRRKGFVVSGDSAEARVLNLAAAGCRRHADGRYTRANNNAFPGSYLIAIIVDLSEEAGLSGDGIYVPDNFIM